MDVMCYMCKAQLEAATSISLHYVLQHNTGSERQPWQQLFCIQASCEHCRPGPKTRLRWLMRSHRSNICPGFVSMIVLCIAATAGNLHCSCLGNMQRLLWQPAKHELQDQIRDSSVIVGHRQQMQKLRDTGAVG